MSKYKLGDIFIGNFPISQRYGENIDYYKSISNGSLLNGHEGVDWATPLGTPIIAPFDGKVVRDGFSAKDYGNYLVIWDPTQLCAVWFCHLQDMTVSTGMYVKRGDLLGHTNNTGNSTGPHLHINFVETNGEGVRLNTGNGSQGFLNILNTDLVEWQLAGAMKTDFAVPTPPITETTQPYLTLPTGENVNDWLPVKKFDFENMRSKCDKYDPIATAGFETLDVIDNKINQLIQEKQNQADIHTGEVLKLNDANTKLKADLQSINDQFQIVLAQYKKNTEEDSHILESHIEEGKVKQQLESDINAIASVLSTNPDKSSIIKAIQETEMQLEQLKNKRPNIFSNIKRPSLPKISIWERIFGIKTKGGETK